MKQICATSGNIAFDDLFTFMYICNVFVCVCVCGVQNEPFEWFFDLLLFLFAHAFVAVYKYCKLALCALD